MHDRRLISVKEAYRAGDKARARQLLGPILQDDSSADAWVMAAYVARDRNEAIAFLKSALRLDPSHEQATELLAKLESASTVSTVNSEPAKPAPQEAQSQASMQTPAPPVSAPPPPRRELPKHIDPHTLNETETRSNFIDPALEEAGWKTPPAFVREEQTRQGHTRLRADYVLFSAHNHAMAVVEAKSYSKKLSAAIDQAKEFAKLEDIPFAYAANGHEIIEYDLIQNRQRRLLRFPTPQELRQRLSPGSIPEETPLAYELTPPTRDRDQEALLRRHLEQLDQMTYEEYAIWLHTKPYLITEMGPEVFRTLLLIHPKLKKVLARTEDSHITVDNKDSRKRSLPAVIIRTLKWAGAAFFFICCCLPLSVAMLVDVPDDDDPPEKPTDARTVNESSDAVTVRADSANIYSGPGTEYEITGTLKGSDNVSGKNGAWFYLRYNEWVYLLDVRVDGDTSALPFKSAPNTNARTTSRRTPTPEPVIWYMTGAENANLRACAALDCQTVEVIAYGDPLQVLDISDGWVEVQLSDGVAYIAEWLISDEKPEPVG